MVDWLVDWMEQYFSHVTAVKKLWYYTENYGTLIYYGKNYGNIDKTMVLR